jgi:hypothetical protein
MYTTAPDEIAQFASQHGAQGPGHSNEKKKPKNKEFKTPTQDHLASSNNSRALKQLALKQHTLKRKPNFSAEAFFNYVDKGGEIYSLGGEAVPHAKLVEVLTAATDIIANGGDKKEAEEKIDDLASGLALDKIFEIGEVENPIGMGKMLYDYMTNTVYGEQLMGEAAADDYRFAFNEYVIALRTNDTDGQTTWGKRADRDVQQMQAAADAIDGLKGGGDE